MKHDNEFNTACAEAARIISESSSLVILTGAGMGVDSGLPDFRGATGFWKAYPHYEKLGVSFQEMANPVHFARDPHFAWGFYGHRLNLYRQTRPHEGYTLLLNLARKRSLPLFAVTSNVDGHFQAAGYPPELTWEVHGSLNYLQCSRPCSRDIWPNKEEPMVDFESMRATEVPLCPHCGSTARPNILMFGDSDFIPDRESGQEDRFNDFLKQNSSPALIEIGAGTAVATIRWLSGRLGRIDGARLIRINPRETGINQPGVSIASGGLAALEQICANLENEK